MISSVKHVRYLAGWCTSELKWRQTNQTKNSETFATILQEKYLGKPQKHLLKQNQMALMHYNIREANFSTKPCSKNANCIFYCGQNPQSNKDEKNNGPQENNMKVQAAWENFSETRLGNELWAWEIIMHNVHCTTRNINHYLHSTSCLVDRNTILKLGRKDVFGIG